jgi:hypothetical protein
MQALISQMEAPPIADDLHIDETYFPTATAQRNSKSSTIVAGKLPPAAPAAQVAPALLFRHVSFLYLSLNCL